MKARDLEEIRQTTDVFINTMSGEFEALKGELEIRQNPGLDVATRVYNAEQTDANSAFVRTVLDVLPGVETVSTKNGYATKQDIDVVCVEDQFTARAVQKNFFWVFSDYSEGAAGYRIGQRDRNRFATDVLVATKGEKSDRAYVRMAGVRKKDLEKADAEVQSNLVKPLDQNELDALFDPRTEEYIIGPSSIGSNRASHKGYIPLAPRSARSIIQYGCAAWGKDKVTELSDEVMARFDVYAHLARMSLELSCEDEFKKALEARLAQAEDAPLDRFLTDSGVDAEN